MISYKYYPIYWNIVKEAAKASNSKKRKVGAVIVSTEEVLSIGWNGTPKGFETNECEYSNDPTKTLPEVIHAERNALDKMFKQGVSPKGAILFVNKAPCLECAKSILNVGIAQVNYKDNHDKDSSGVELLVDSGIHVLYYGKPD